MTMAGRWLGAARAVLDRIEATQMAAIAATAERCARAIAADGLVHMFGSGHSRIALEEMFPRYSSFPGFHPIAELSMTFHTQIAGANGQRQAMFIERVEGLAEQILANFRFGRDDLMIVCSASGRSAVPIEMACGARERGLPVVAITSLEQSLGGPSGHSSGTRLADHADILIDLCTASGDGMVTLDGIDTPVGPGSTVAYAAVVNEIKVQTAALLAADGKLPPVLTSSTVVGDERSRQLFEAAYHDHGRRIGRVLAGTPDVPDGTEPSGHGGRHATTVT